MNMADEVRRRQSAINSSTERARSEDLERQTRNAQLLIQYLDELCPDFAASAKQLGYKSDSRSWAKPGWVFVIGGGVTEGERRTGEKFLVRTNGSWSFVRESQTGLNSSTFKRKDAPKYWPNEEDKGALRQMFLRRLQERRPW